MANGRDSIQAIFIKQTETRHDPKAYTAYRIDVQAAVRQWHIWKRYSDFIKLHEQLSHTFPHNPVPAHLPQKRIFPPTFNSLERIEDRRQGLEDYLRTIQSCRDDRWRKTDIWYHFLALPENEPKATSAEGLTFGSWLDEYDELLTISREIRSLINSRNAHQSQHEVSDAMQCEFKAKKGLATLTARLAILESSLMDDGHVQFLAEGEERRREDKLNRLKVERDVLQQLVSATRQDAHKKKKPAPPPPSSVATAHYGDIGF
ncbi:Phox homologous domain-containing protein, partial [Gilbertella persicaria]